MGEKTGERPTGPADGGGEQREGREVPIVGIGASAGGLVAMEQFLEGLSSDTGMAFVVVQHLSPDHESGLVKLLSGYTPLEVLQAEEGIAVEPNQIYVIPPDSQLALAEGRLNVSARSGREGMPATIDEFFRTLADEKGPLSACIILSGTGTDGSLGLRAIKQEGGFVLVQSESDADYGGMPRSAIETGLADVVAPANELAARLVAIFGHPDHPPAAQPEGSLGDERERGLVEILRLLRLRTGSDFSLYKRATVLRRVSRRMQVCHCEQLSDYLDYLEEHAEEVRLLYRDLLISVTNFFRDPEVWRVVEREVIPGLFEGKGSQDEVRVWVVGCATGEEAYTVGMLLQEYADRLENPPELKVFATDINPDVIERARRGIYPRQIAADVSAGRLRRFFVEEGEGYRVVKELRNDILFAAQNALEDPPFSEIDFISCRNLLIYLKSRAQKRLLKTLHYALRAGGELLLGCSETVNAAAGLFTPVDGQHRIYESVNVEKPRSFMPGADWMTGLVEPSEPSSREPPLSDEEVHQQVMMEHYVPPSVLVDTDYQLLHVHGRVDPYVRISEGRPTRNLLEMLHGQLRPQLQTMLFRVAQKDSDRLERRLTLGGEEGHRQVEVQVHRYDRQEGLPALEVSFRAVEEPAESSGGSTEDESMQPPVVEQLQRELEAVRARLRVTIEEYESANEEMKASNEELLSMNEELQSTTEELETSKEELQSMNEELTTVNEELNAKIEQLDAVNNDLTNLLSSTEIGTVFLDRDFRVKRYTEPVVDFLHLIPADRGRPFEHVTHDLESDRLLADAERSLADLEVIEREVRSEDGRWFLVRTLPYRTLDDRIDGVVITFIEMTRRKEAERRLAESEKRFRTFFDSASDAMFVYEIDAAGGQFQEVNASAVEMLGLSADELRGLTLPEIVADEGFSFEQHIERLKGEGWSREETVVVGSGGEELPVEIHARLFEHEPHQGVVAAVRDMKRHKQYEKVLIEAKEKAEELAELRSMFLSTMSHEVRSPLTAILSYAEVLSRQVEGEAAESVERIRQSGNRLRDSLDTVLQMARMESKEIEPNLQRFDLAEIVAEAVDLRRRQADQKGLEVASVDPEEEVIVELDEQFVRQILGNLIDNAIKYTDEGFVRVEIEEQGDKVCVSVADSGIGISAEEQERIFERFARGHGVRSTGKAGVGLGLAIVGLLVEALEGEIELDSAEGEGSIFRVRLPRRPP